MSEQKPLARVHRPAQTKARDGQGAQDTQRLQDRMWTRLRALASFGGAISARGRFDLALLAGSVLVFGLLSLAQRQDVNWDLLNYHYYNGYAAVQGGRPDFVPAMLQTFTVPTADIPTYLLIAHLPPVAVGFLVGGFQGTCFWLVFQIASSLIHLAHPWLERAVWFACAALGMYAPTARAQLGSSMQDLTLSVLVLAGLLLLLRVSTGEIEGRRARVAAYAGAGLLLGFAVGCKYTMAPYALAGVLAFTLVPRLEALKSLALVGAGSLAGLFAGCGWWMLHLYQAYGNPFFPLYNDVFHSPDAVDYVKGLAPFPPKTWEQAVFTPFFFTTTTSYPTSEVPFQDFSFAAIFILLVVLLIALAVGIPTIRGTFSPVRVRFVVFFVVSFALWQAIFEGYRYLAPLQLLAPVMLYLLLQWIVTDEMLRVLAVLGVFVGLALTSYAPGWGRVPWGDRYFAVDAPALADPAHSLVLMDTQQPYAYTIPSFPREVTFANLEGNWKYVGSTLDYAEERAAIAAHAGPIYLMSPDVDPAHADAVLAPYHLALVPGTCSVIAYQGAAPESWPPPISFCQVRPAPAAPHKAAP
jgi:hypothetical protein